MKMNDLSPDHMMAIEAMKSQLLLVLVNRLGGEVTIPVKEIDDTGNLVMLMNVDTNTRDFTFTVKRKDELCL